MCSHYLNSVQTVASYLQQLVSKTNLTDSTPVTLQRKDPNYSNSGIQYRQFDIDKEHYVNTYTDDFIERARSIFAAAKFCLQNDSNFTDETKEIKRRALSMKEEKLINEIARKFLLQDEDIIKKRGNKYYLREDLILKKQKAFLNYLRKTVLPQCAIEIYQPKENYRSALERIRRSEIQISSKKGRPTFYNVISKQNNPKMFSMQIPVGYYTDEQWSKIQDHQRRMSVKRSYTHASYERGREGMSNFVLQATGYFNQQKPIVTSVFTRHTSYSPSEISDPILRLLMGQRQVKQYIEVLTNHLIDEKNSADILKNNSEQNPYEIKLAKLCLLSAIKNIFTRGDSQKQRQQVMESYLMLNMCQQKPFQVTFRKDNGEKQKVWVKPEINFMATGVNAVRFKTISSKWRAAINTRSFNLLSQSLYQYIYNNQPDEVNEIIKSYEDNVESKLINLKKSVEESWEDVQYHFIRLRELITNYETSEQHEQWHKELEKACKEKINEVQNILWKHHEKERILRDKRRQLWNRNKKVFIVALQNLKNQHLQIHPFQDSEHTSKIRHFYDIFNDYVLAQEIYYKDEQYKAKHNYWFQNIWLRLNKRMGRNIDFYCNDGEDRTGRLAITIESTDYFYVNEGKDPDYRNSNDVKKCLNLQTELATRSSSIENTNANIPGARGLEVHKKDGNTDYDTGKGMAQLAKGAYKSPSKYEIFRRFVELIFERKNKKIPKPDSENLHSSKSDKMSDISVLSEQFFDLYHEGILAKKDEEEESRIETTHCYHKGDLFRQARDSLSNMSTQSKPILEEKNPYRLGPKEEINYDDDLSSNNFVRS